MIRKIFSIFGIVAVVAFFLPWLKACEDVESGFQLLILDSIQSFDIGSLSSLNTGLVLLLVPLFAVLFAWLIKELENGIIIIPQWLLISYIVLLVLSVINTGIWGGLEISAIIKEWGTEGHVHAIYLAKLLGFHLIGAVLFFIFTFTWKRSSKFNPGWGLFILVFPIFGTVGFGLSFKPNYYGIYLYIAAMAALAVGSLIDGIKFKKGHKKEGEVRI